MRREGKTTHLRDLELKDLDSLEYWLHPSHEWHKFNGPYYPPIPGDKIPDRIQGFRESITKADHPTPRRALAIVNASDEIMGSVTRYWISQETNWTAIGLSIWNPENWGKGYGYQALGLWCDYLFEVEPEFVRLDARTWSGNHGMMRLAEKLGFTREATFRMARIVNGNYYDGLGYGILRTEWNERYPDGFSNHL